MFVAAPERISSDAAHMHSDSGASTQATTKLFPRVTFITSDISPEVNSDIDEHIAYAVSSMVFL